MFGKFFKNYGATKVKDGMQSFHDAIVAWDPEGASEASIAMMEENFDKLNVDFSKAKAEYVKEKQEADVIQELYNKRMNAAENIQAQLAADPENTQLSTALNQLVEALEDMQDDVEREVEEAQYAKTLMDELEETVKVYSTKLKTARKDFDRARKEIERAERQEQRAKEQADRAAVEAGIRKQAGGISSALESMSKQAEEARANADALERKAKLLKPVEVEENDIIKRAMEGDSPTKELSVADRLAKLKG